MELVNIYYFIRSMPLSLRSQRETETAKQRVRERERLCCVRSESVACVSVRASMRCCCCKGALGSRRLAAEQLQQHQRWQQRDVAALCLRPFGDGSAVDTGALNFAATALRSWPLLQPIWCFLGALIFAKSSHLHAQVNLHRIFAYISTH